MNDLITIAVVDDEELARKRIRNLLLKYKGNYTIYECRNGLEAVNTINEKGVDIVFLDIQMPELNGFEVIDHLDKDNIPVILFVTAYDNFALKAFEIHALDYLLKPFDDERFKAAFDFALEQVETKDTGELKKKVLDLISDKSLYYKNKYLSRILIKSSGRIYFVQCNEIIRIKAAGKYLEILAGNEKHAIRKTMCEIEQKLDPDKFIRIHRSVIINIDRIKEIQHWYKNEYIFLLDNLEKFTSGSTYRKNLDRILENV